MQNLSRSTTAQGKMVWWEWLILLLGLFLFGVQALWASPSKSASFDEQYHLTAGYAYLQTGDFRLATNHPPLMGLLGGLPLLGGEDIALPLENSAWETGDRYRFSDVFLWESGNPAHELLVRARQPIVGIGLLLLVALFFAARSLFGRYASWLVLTVSALDPNLLANARVVTTDMGLTCFLFIALWQFHRWLERYSWLALGLAGLFAGLTMGAKYSGLLIWPVAVIVLLLYPLPQQQNFVKELGRRLGGLLVMGLIACGVLWAIYGFDTGPLAALPIAISLPAPFYWQHVWNTLFRIVDLSEARLDFLLGEASSAGWWYYFLVAFAVKTPIPTLLLIGAGLVTMLRRGEWRRQAVLWVPPLWFFGMGLSGIFTVGYRHILPVLPFLILLAANVTRWLSNYSQPRPVRIVGRSVPALLCLWLVITTLRFCPHHDSFFNGFAGHWSNWSNILVDSNLDWGQDLPALRQTIDALEIERVNLAYFGKAVPEEYGVRYTPLPGYLRFVEGIELNAYNPYAPEPGWYAISATSLRLGLFQPESVDLYAYFRELTPDARAGYSIYLYNVQYPATLPVERATVTATPLSQLPVDILTTLPEKRLQIKWSRSVASEIVPVDQTLQQSPKRYQPVDANFEDIFTLQGFVQEPAILQPGQPLALTLYWQVGTEPMPMPQPTRGRPTSVFVQLTDAGDPTAIHAQYDGWEVALRGLEPGDVIMQRIALNVDEGLPDGQYDLLAGIYSPQNWVRLMVTVGGEQASDHVKLTTLPQ